MSMGGSGKARTERACTISWFTNWDSNQKSEFGQLLLKLHRRQKSTTDGVASDGGGGVSVDDLMANMTKLSVAAASSSVEGPSIFQCQLCIFEKWFGGWEPSDQSDFVSDLSLRDPQFVQSLQAEIQKI